MWLGPQGYIKTTHIAFGMTAVRNLGKITRIEAVSSYDSQIFQIGKN